jgi:hypothetical protein
MSPMDEISGADLALALDTVGAFWDNQPHYALLMVEAGGLVRTCASALVLVGMLVEMEAEHRGLSREQCLGVIRGAVA